MRNREGGVQVAPRGGRTRQVRGLDSGGRVEAGRPAIRSTAGTRLCRGVRTGTARTRTGSWNAWSSPSMMACSTARLERAMVCLLIEVKRPSMLQCGVLLTQTGQSPDQNPALQQAPDLMPANPLCCQLGKGQ